MHPLTREEAAHVESNKIDGVGPVNTKPNMRIFTVIYLCKVTGLS